MDKRTESKRRLSPLTIAIIALSVLIVAEGAFLLLHRGSDAGAAGGASAAAGADAAASDGAGDASADADAPADAAGSAAGQSADGSTDSKGDDKAKNGGSKSADKSGSGGTNAQTPVQTPAVEIPEQNKGKPYAAAIAYLQNYLSSPTQTTLSYLLGGELTGDQMARFLPAALTLSGQSFEEIQAQMSADLNLPQGAATLVVTNETPLSQEDLSAAAAQMQVQLDNYTAVSESFRDYKSFNANEWEQLGAQFGISGTEAKQLVLSIGDSAAAMADRLTGVSVTEGYDVTLQAGNGEILQVKVFCINGKWVTAAFFDTQI